MVRSPLLGRICHGASWLGWVPRLGDDFTAGFSFGAGQVQLRRAEAVDLDVRDAIVNDICPSDACSELVGQHWSTGMGDLVGRLRDEKTNILYVGAYLNRLRGAAPPGSSWETIYGTTFDPELGSYNGDPKFVQGFLASRNYYSYLDLDWL